MSARFCLALVMLVTSACFREPAQYAEGRSAPHTLLVRDPGGASYSLDRAPREPTLSLAFDDAPPFLDHEQLVLLPGVFLPAFFARLQGKTSALTQRSLPLVVEAHETSWTLSPEQALLAGSHYTLGWLADEDSRSFVLTVAPGEASGARWAESWPSAGDTQVPANLTRVLVRFDGSVVGDLSARLSLEGELPVPTRLVSEPCEARGLPAGDCVWLEPTTPLLPGTRYRIVLAAGLSTRTGAMLPASETHFETTRAMSQPVLLVPTRCALDERSVDGLCTRSDEHALYVRGTTSTSALVTLLAASADTVARVATLSFANAFVLALPLPKESSAVLLRLVDLSGGLLERELTATRETTLVAVTIDEARPDPLGKEPAQEYVELLNSGVTPVSLMGFTLSTDLHARGRAITSSVMLAPSERALLVSPDFDPRDAADGALPGGTRIVTLDGSLSLSNGGDMLYLRDALGRRLSSARVLAPLLEGQCSTRLSPEAREGDSVLDPSGGCSPGAASAFPPAGP